MTLLHEQYESDGSPVLFRCRECGFTSLSLGTLHAHCESHRGYTRFNIQLPLTSTAIANVDALLEMTEILRVEKSREIGLEELDGL
ncbi:hypothetical protein [Natranaeroarchaeum sulfidigenes]|uniref:C2H2-type domain-containing protein n=1 Tax=Natranaeroarchaeum sulfidigenes TaxID=2784880 RepID=A0A897MQ08_9EURY|nr:hypothetical protein [Natranaeroarchaeum sulfidigenes]QSG02512.1 Uncharacterized protein AArcS_1295 [Natranaeroarchaeum sulfidigenes]